MIQEDGGGGGDGASVVAQIKNVSSKEKLRDFPFADTTFIYAPSIEDKKTELLNYTIRFGTVFPEPTRHGEQAMSGELVSSKRS